MIGVIVWVLGGVLVAAAAGGWTYRAVLRRRTAKALDIRTPNGIAEAGFVRIGGIGQWIQIRGEDRRNPVLLVLHGGPGMSYLGITPLFRSWERHFTVVQWDQRGAGRTYGHAGKAKKDPITLDRIVEDGIEVAEHLCRRLRQERIILIGHSAGSMVGLGLIRRRPDLFHAYVGTGQVADMVRNDTLSYERLLERVRAAGNTRAVRALEAMGPPPYRNARTWIAKQRWIMRTDQEIRAFQRMALPMTLSEPGYSLRDFFHQNAGLISTITRTYDEIMSYRADRWGGTFHVPVVILQGETDEQALTSLAEEQFATITAPHKEWVTLTGHGHLAMLVAPDRFLDELLARVRPLARGPQGQPGELGAAAVEEEV